jgi:hypothetical protein
MYHQSGGSRKKTPQCKQMFHVIRGMIGRKKQASISKGGRQAIKM